MKVKKSELMFYTAYSGECVLHDIIFLFHMPLFFVFSGFLLEGNRGKEYLTYKAKRLLIPWETNIYYNRCRNSNLSCGRYSLMRKLFGLPKLESENF